jgi:hypothetical protein
MQSPNEFFKVTILFVGENAEAALDKYRLMLTLKNIQHFKTDSGAEASFQIGNDGIIMRFIITNSVSNLKEIDGVVFCLNNENEEEFHKSRKKNTPIIESINNQHLGKKYLFNFSNKQLSMENREYIHSFTKKHQLEYVRDASQLYGKLTILALDSNNLDKSIEEYDKIESTPIIEFNKITKDTLEKAFKHAKSQYLGDKYFFKDSSEKEINTRLAPITTGLDDSNCLSRLFKFLTDPKGNTDLKSYKYLVVSSLANIIVNNDKEATALVDKVIGLLNKLPQINTQSSAHDNDLYKL